MPITTERLHQLLAAAKSLPPEDILSIQVSRYDEPEIHVWPRTLAEICQLVGRQAEKLPGKSGHVWTMRLELDGVVLSALAYPEQLPLFGYPVEPVPAEVESEPALQAS